MSDPTCLPRVHLVNTLDDPGLTHPLLGPFMAWGAHPPEVDLWQPMHATHRLFMQSIAALGWTSPLDRNYRGFCKCAKALGIKTEEEQREEFVRRVHAFSQLERRGAFGGYPGIGGGFGGGFGGFGF